MIYVLLSSPWNNYENILSWKVEGWNLINWLQINLLYSYFIHFSTEISQGGNMYVQLS